MMQKGCMTHMNSNREGEGRLSKGIAVGMKINNNLRIDLILCNQSKKVHSSKVIFNGTTEKIW